MEAEVQIEEVTTRFRVAIHAQGVPLVDELRQRIEERLWTNLRAHAGRIVVAHVRLWVPTDADGPAICHVRVELRPSGGLALGEIASDLRTAVARATERMRVALAAQVARPGSGASQAWLR